MKRREFIALFGGAAAWPFAARAQQPERTWRIGVLINLAAHDPEGHARVTAFAQGLQEAGWTNDEPALVSAVDGAGSAMLFSVAAAI
jgi:putative ABC transport system substrate-binding protein